MPDAPLKDDGPFRLVARGTSWRVLMFQGELHVMQVDSGVVTCAAWRLGANDTEHTRRWTFLGADVVDIAVSQSGRLVAALGGEQVVVAKLTHRGADVWPPLELPGRVDVVAVSEVSHRDSVVQAGVLVADTTAGKTWRCSLSSKGQRAPWRGMDDSVLDVVGGRSGTFLLLNSSGDLVDGGQFPRTKERGTCEEVDFRRASEGDTCVLRGRDDDGSWLRVLHRSASGDGWEDLDYRFDESAWGRVMLARGTTAWSPLVVEDLSLDEGSTITFAEPDQMAPPAKPAPKVRRAPKPFLDEFRFHVFINYSRGGRSQEIAEEMYWACTGLGLSVWWDLAQDKDDEAPILMRGNYKRDAKAGLRQSLALVCIWGERSTRPREDPEMKLSQRRELAIWRRFEDGDLSERLSYRIVADGLEGPQGDSWHNHTDDGPGGHVVRDLAKVIREDTEESVLRQLADYEEERAGSSEQPAPLEVLD